MSGVTVRLDRVPFSKLGGDDTVETLSWWGAGGLSLVRRVPAYLRPRLGRRMVEIEAGAKAKAEAKAGAKAGARAEEGAGGTGGGGRGE